MADAAWLLAIVAVLPLDCSFLAALFIVRGPDVASLCCPHYAGRTGVGHDLADPSACGGPTGGMR